MKLDRYDKITIAACIIASPFVIWKFYQIISLFVALVQLDLTMRKIEHSLRK